MGVPTRPHIGRVRGGGAHLADSTDIGSVPHCARALGRHLNRLRFSAVTEKKLAESDLDVVVTGGGGWLGQATLEMLESAIGVQMPEGARLRFECTAARTPVGH